MKKQFQILAATFITVAFISCSKEKIETNEAGNSGEIATAINSKNPGAGVGTLNKGLLGRFEFNGTLKDTTGHLADGVSTIDRVLYTRDRKGAANRAIRFNEAYGVNIFNVPLDTNMSVSVWVQYDILAVDFQLPFVEGSQSFSLSQFENSYQGAYWNGISGQYVTSGPINNLWHHLVATRDGISLKFYIDGNFIGSAPSPSGSGPYIPTNDYVIGYGYNNGYKYWKGNMDDLRIYKRVLSTVEVNNLANL